MFSYHNELCETGNQILSEIKENKVINWVSCLKKENQIHLPQTINPDKFSIIKVMGSYS